MPRRPVVEGMFYPKEFTELENQIKKCFLSDLGPKSFPKFRSKKLKGVISPHAGYIYSGASAAHVFKEIGEAEFPDLFIIIGPNHSGLGQSSVLLENMETPFGEIQTDIEFGKALVRNSSLIDDRIAHLSEHSVEVQLPFLQFVSKDNIKKLKIIPIVVGYCNPIEIGKAIRKTIEEQNKTVIIIASSDFVHYGVNYDYTPFKQDIKENIAKIDNKTYNFIEQLDTKGFLNYCEESGATICGVYPIAILMEAIDGKSELLSHYISSEVSGDVNNCVDYMAVVFR